MTEHFLLYQNKKIYYSIFGEGKTVMLVHGFGEDGSIWESQAKFLSTHFQVIVPDIPGSGHSELIPNADIETYAQVLRSTSVLSTVYILLRDCSCVRCGPEMYRGISCSSYIDGSYSSLSSLSLPIVDRFP